MWNCKWCDAKVKNRIAQSGTTAKDEEVSAIVILQCYGGSCIRCLSLSSQ